MLQSQNVQKLLSRRKTGVRNARVRGGVLVENPLNSLKKQVGCFNHRVVTTVADKLKRQWLREVCFGTMQKQICCFNHRMVTLVAVKLWFESFTLIGNWIRQPEEQVLNV